MEKPAKEGNMTEECPTCPKPEENPKFSCEVTKFEPFVCSEDKTGVLFIGRETENPDGILKEVMDAGLDEAMNFGVIDFMDDTCEELSLKYKIDRDATQLVIFQKCEKINGISLEGNPKEQIAKLKASLVKDEKIKAGLREK